MKPALLSIAVCIAILLTGGCNRKESASAEPEVRSDDAGGADSTEAQAAGEDAAIESERDGLLAAELEAYEAAKPVFARHCARCHDPDGEQANAAALKHFSMQDYPFGGHHAHELGETIPAVVGAGEDEATMPKDDPGAVTADERARLVEWAEAYERAQAAGAGHHAEPTGRDLDHDHDHDHGGGGHDH